MLDTDPVRGDGAAGPLEPLEKLLDEGNRFGMARRHADRLLFDDEDLGHSWS